MNDKAPKKKEKMDPYEGNDRVAPSSQAPEDEGGVNKEKSQEDAKDKKSDS